MKGFILWSKWGLKYHVIKSRWEAKAGFANFIKQYGGNIDRSGHAEDIFSKNSTSIHGPQAPTPNLS